MKRLTTIEELKAFRESYVIDCYSNFQQLLNGKTEEEAAEERRVLAELNNNKSHRVYMPFKDECYLAEDAEYQIYDLGGGYYMMTCKQSFHKAVNKILAKEGVKELKPDFTETVSIYKVVK